MRKNALNFIGKFKFNSIFFKTFSNLFVLLIFIIVIFFCLAMYLISENYKEKVYDSNLNLLSNTSNSIDYNLTSVVRSMRQVFQNQYIISAMITSKVGNYQRNIDIINQLNSSKKSNKLIKNILLYIPTQNTIYSFSGGIYNVNQFIDKHIIDAYDNNSFPGEIIEVDNYLTEIKRVDDRIVLYQNFYPPGENLKRVGIIIFEINTNELNKIILENIKYIKSNVYLFDQNNNPILPKEIDYSKVDLINKSVLNFSNNTGSLSGERIINTHGNYIFFQSDLTKWKYVYPVDNNIMQFAFKVTLSAVLPLIVIFFLLGMLYSIYITLRIYRPIDKVLMSIFKKEERKLRQMDGKNAADELEFFAMAYDDAVDRSDRLNTVIQSISPAVLDRLFTYLLFGRELEINSIMKTLESVGSHFSMESGYAVLNVTITLPNNKVIPEIEMNINIIRISGVVRNILKADANYIIVRTGDSTASIILSFSLDVSVITIKQIMISLCNDISDKMSSSPYNVFFGCGNIYNKITDLKYSYMEAQDDLKYNLYLGDKCIENDQEEKHEEDNFNKRYFNERLRSIIHRLNDDNLAGSLDIIKHVTEEISRRLTDQSHARQKYEMFIDCFFEKLIELKININEQVFKKRKTMDKSFDSFTDLKQMEQYSWMICREAVETIDIYNKKQQHKYILRAKEYIDNNYFNSSLSLNMVAEHIGITPSYLSKLFNEELNVYFVDYLNKLRVEKVKQLLNATELTTKEIGFKAGFNSMQNFFRVFKKYENVSPGKYRPKNIDAN